MCLQWDSRLPQGCDLERKHIVPSALKPSETWVKAVFKAVSEYRDCPYRVG